MSRCFSYPPPYFQESLIDLIKLQKEKEKTKAKAKLEKKQKKKERKEKKERRKEENKEKRESKGREDIAACQDSQNLQPKELNHGKRKFEDSLKRNIDGNELFEGSGVTEEHESPGSIQRNFESSESSQDSGRRKLPAPVHFPRNNGTLRFKMPVSKSEGSGLTSLPVIRKKDSQEKLSLPSGGQMNLNPRLLPVSIARQQNRQSTGAEQPDTSKLKRKFEVAVTSEPHPQTKVARIINPKAPYMSTVASKVSLSKPWSLPVTAQKDKESLPRQQNPELGTSKLVLKVDACFKKELQPQINQSVARSREDPEKDLKGFEQNVSLGPVARQKSKERKTELLPVAGYKCQEAPVLRSKSEIKEAAGSGEQACFSGRIKTIAQKVELPTKSGTGAESFAELFTNWKPLSLGFCSSDSCDEDWLFPGLKGQSSSCMKKCDFNAKDSAKDSSSVSGGSCTAFLQPRATFMQELNMFVLPYAVPF